MFIVEIEDGTWLAPWDGDPGRTLVKDNSKKFKTEDAAKRALKKACTIPHRNFTSAKVLCV